MAYDKHFMPLYVKYFFWAEQPLMGLPSSIPRLCGDKRITTTFDPFVLEGVSNPTAATPFKSS
jgi:hypothetical protein